jgi:hypothetical protein
MAAHSPEAGVVLCLATSICEAGAPVLTRDEAVYCCREPRQ